jgi:DNA-directed RNA polymerase subunit A'
VNTNKANFIVRKSGVRINLKYAMIKKGTDLLYGDVVIRNESRITVTNNNVILKNGDILERDGRITDVRYPEQKKIELELGDEVHRHLKDGDMGLFNRQPTKLVYGWNRRLPTK